MIIQGTNSPIVLTFSESMTDILDIEISLMDMNGKEFKHWTSASVTIDGVTVTAPITQAESVLFPVGKCFMELKWLDENGKVNFAKNITNTIIERYDKTIMEGAN